MIEMLVIVSVLFLAYANGANDNFKGVATLLGSGTVDYRRALAWATVTTFAGSLAALWIGVGLIETFSGKGLVDATAVADPCFLASVALGAAGTVILATVFGLPISTTHGLIGALVGAGLATTRDVDGTRLGSAFLALLVSPLIALAATVTLYPLLRRARRALGVTRQTCVCVGEEIRVIATEGCCATEAIARPTGRLRASVGTVESCFERYEGRVLGVSAQQALDWCHYLSAGAVGFARGLNDAPKIAAILFAVGASGLSLAPGIASVAAAMALGGILQARRVARTMGYRITGMNHGQGFTGNLVAAILVLFASQLGVPVSTTHVTCGALFGIGLVNRQAHGGMIRKILASWVITLPTAGFLSATAYGVIKGTLS